MIVDIRIDDRLVHGQVVQGWVPMLDVDKLLVVCDSQQTCDSLNMIYQLSFSQCVEIELVESTALADAYDKAFESSQRVMVVTDEPGRISQLPPTRIQPRITLGNLHTDEKQKVRIGSSIECCQEQVNQLESLLKQGVKVVVCPGANDKVKEIDDFPCSA